MLLSLVALKKILNFIKISLKKALLNYFFFEKFQTHVTIDAIMVAVFVSQNPIDMIGKLKFYQWRHQTNRTNYLKYFMVINNYSIFYFYFIFTHWLLLISNNKKSYKSIINFFHKKNIKRIRARNSLMFSFINNSFF